MANENQQDGDRNRQPGTRQSSNPGQQKQQQDWDRSDVNRQGTGSPQGGQNQQGGQNGNPQGGGLGRQQQQGGQQSAQPGQGVQQRQAGAQSELDVPIEEDDDEALEEQDLIDAGDDDADGQR